MKRLMEWIRGFLSGTPKPILNGLYILLSGIVAVAASPMISHYFEQQSRQSAFYLSTLEALTSDTKTLVSNLSILYEEDLAEDKRQDVYLEVRRNITKLHWRSFEFGLIYHPEISDRVKKYQTTLSALEAEVMTSEKGTKGNIRGELEDFGLASARLVEFLARKSGVRGDGYISDFIR